MTLLSHLTFVSRPNETVRRQINLSGVPDFDSLTEQSVWRANARTAVTIDSTVRPCTTLHTSLFGKRFITCLLEYAEARKPEIQAGSEALVWSHDRRAPRWNAFTNSASWDLLQHFARVERLLAAQGATSPTPPEAGSWWKIGALLGSFNITH